MYITFFANVTPSLQVSTRIFIDLKTLLYTIFHVKFSKTRNFYRDRYMEPATWGIFLDKFAG